MSWNALNLAASEFESRPEPPSVCGLVYAQRRHLVSGPPEAAKTLFSLIVGLEVIRAGGTFALVDFESGPHATRLALSELGATLEEIRMVHYVEAEQAPGHDDVQEIVNCGATLAIIDAAAGAYGVSGLDDNKRQDAEIFGAAWIDPLWRAGVATLLNDHVVKNSDARGKFAIGSERKAGRTDVHLGLDAVMQLSRGRTGLIRITTHKDRPGWLPRPRAGELELRSDPDTHALTWQFRTADQDGDPWRPTVLMEKVSAYLEQQHEPVSRKTIEDNVPGRAEYLRAAMDALVLDGYAREEEGPRRSRLLTFHKAFTSSDLVPTSSGRTEHRLRPSSPPLQGDEDEVDRPLTIEELGRLPLTTLAAMHERGEL